MFIGHYAVGFASKKIAPETSLGTLFIAALWLDLLWPVFQLLGIERVGITPGITKVVPLDFEYYPFSHSLLAVLLWGVSLGLAYYLFRRLLRPAIVIGVLVVSHWFLDAIVHRPDLPVSFTGGTRVGLGLWNSVGGTLLVEGGIFIAGAALYLSSTRAVDKTGRYGARGLIGVLLLIYAGQFLGSAPPSAKAVAVTGLFQWLFVLFAFWVDRHRKAG